MRDGKTSLYHYMKRKRNSQLLIYKGAMIIMEKCLEINELEKIYPDFKIDKISFDIKNGSIMGLIGENGAGKSTTIKSVLDLIRKDGGKISFWNKSIENIDKEDIAVVYDECCFHDVLNAKQLDIIMSHIYKKWDSTKYYNLLEEFNLPHKKRIKDYSKGMKMKLSIAVALSHSPRLLILDEATSGLDPIVRDQVLDVFLRFISNGKNSILMSSHITSDLEKIADCITFIHDGSVIFTESKEKLLDEYGILKCNKKEFENIEKGYVKAHIEDGKYSKVLITNRKEVQAKHSELSIDTPSIDDIMFMHVKGEY